MEIIPDAVTVSILPHIATKYIAMALFLVFDMDASFRQKFLIAKDNFFQMISIFDTNLRYHACSGV